MKPLVASVKSVLFDLDGTLVDTHIDFALMKREMTSLALSTGIDEVQLDGLDILGIAKAGAAYLSKTCGARNRRSFYSQAMVLLEEIELRHARATESVPFALEAVAMLRARGVGIGIVTRNCRRASEMSLQIVGITPDVLICREDSQNHKPHPEPVLLALERLNAQPGNSIMVGDHIMDVQSGKAAGLKTIGFLREDRAEDFFDAVQPDFVARSLREVMGAIIDSDR
jgi:phosphoglycolate phosphatase